MIITFTAIGETFGVARCREETRLYAGLIERTRKEENTEMNGFTRCSIQVALLLDQDEGLPDDVATTEAIVEGGICDALAKFCAGTIIVEAVSVRYERAVFLYEEELKLSECA